MRKNNKIIVCLISAAIFTTMIGVGCNEKKTDGWLPITEDVNGTITTIQGMQVLKVWGTPYEMGYANGYLAAPVIHDLYLEAVEVHDLTNEKLNSFYPLLDTMTMPARYEEELRGILAGMEARAGGPVYMEPLGRNLTFEDIYAGHVVEDFDCSSFTAWGPMTSDGSLIGGTNKDWTDNAGLLRRDTQWIIVRFPAGDSGRKAWISINNPGMLSCSKGINEDGLFVHMHDAQGRPNSETSGFLMDDLFFMEVLEKIELNSTAVRIRNLLVPFTTTDGTNMMVGMPYSGINTPSCKLEIDGDETFENGVSIWEPVPQRPYLVSTNHFRKRLTPPSDTWRFDYDTNQLEAIYNSGGRSFLTVDQAFEMLQNTMTSSDAVTSIVYEPNKMLLHHALILKGQTVNDINIVTLDLTELFTH